jgi:hypothetical protein
MGGTSDGWHFSISFRGTTLQKTYEMVTAFLKEEGYADVPIPKNAEELKLFRKQKQTNQLNIFSEVGYVHNPIKILFPGNSIAKNTLILHLYNDQEPTHLLRFHNLIV